MGMIKRYLQRKREEREAQARRNVAIAMQVDEEQRRRDYAASDDWEDRGYFDGR